VVQVYIIPARVHLQQAYNVILVQTIAREDISLLYHLISHVYFDFLAYLPVEMLSGLDTIGVREKKEF
jgi:hypothetical protein